ncbi:MAG TPA: CPBP family glutamic-type intramembrane protease [Planctomycetota bacterium]
MSRPGRRAGGPPSADLPSLARGYLAALPLFLAYELALVGGAGTLARSPAESFVAFGFLPLGERVLVVRFALLVVLAGLALVHEGRAASRPARPLAGALGADVALGALAGFLLAPLLHGLATWLGSPPLAAAPEPARGLSLALRLAGAAAWEELLFRVALYGGLYLLVRRTGAFLGLASPLAQGAAELAALLASAALFALFHLDALQRALGGAGEPFHAGLFLWRLSAGILLGGLFRWRGLGVAAWAHAVFNLGIALGLGR